MIALRYLQRSSQLLPGVLLIDSCGFHLSPVQGWPEGSFYLSPRKIRQASFT